MPRAPRVENAPSRGDSRVGVAVGEGGGGGAGGGRSAGGFSYDPLARV